MFRTSRELVRDWHGGWKFTPITTLTHSPTHSLTQGRDPRPLSASTRAAALSTSRRFKPRLALRHLVGLVVPRGDVCGRVVVRLLLAHRRWFGAAAVYDILQSPAVRDSSQALVLRKVFASTVRRW